MNKSVERIGFDILSEYFGFFVQKQRDLNCISVGSGNGVIEYMLKNIYPDINMICVDPKPQSFIKFPKNGQYIAPKFPDVNELIKTEPSLVNNCVLLLIWPEPDKLYDMEAINLLCPIGVISVYETENVSGSQEFHKWRKNGTYNEKFTMQKDINEKFAGRYFSMHYKISLFIQNLIISNKFIT